MPKLFPSTLVSQFEEFEVGRLLWILEWLLCCVLAAVLSKLVPIVMGKLFRFLYRRCASPAPQPEPYENSIWDALESPTTYFLIIYVVYRMLLYRGILRIVPTAIMPTAITEHISQSWRGAVVIYIIWFLYGCKKKFLKRALMEVHKDNQMIFDKLLSLILIVLGVIGWAEVYHLPVQSIITFGGMGVVGVATTFIAKDLFSNVLSGLYLQLAKPFAIGDNIKVGSAEGRVTEMGITSTSLSLANGSTVIVPNSFFSSQLMIVKVKESPRTHGD